MVTLAKPSIIYLMLLCLCVFTPNLYASDFSAKVDRDNINMGEQFTLTLRYADNMDFDDPDLSALKEHFQILNRQRRSQSSISIGATTQAQTYTLWQILLAPKKSGHLSIPAIHFKGQHTNPIAITVNAPATHLQHKQKDNFFIRSIDKQNAYVQEQIIYREKFYHKQPFGQAEISEFKIPNAHVVPLGGAKQYRSTLNGESYNVVEHSFAIFAEQAGELVIPTRTITGYNAYGNYFSASTENQTLSIQAIPKTYPNAPWLVAKHIQLQEDYTPSTNEWQVGQAVTRSIRIVAAGAHASQLTALPMQEVATLKYYPDELKSDNQITPNGIQGKLIQSMALVATQTGNIELPEIRLPFFNSQTQQIQYATLPARSIRIKDTQNAQQSTTTTAKPQTNTATKGADKQNTTAPNTAPKAPPLWQWLSFILVLSNLLFAYLWWNKKSSKTTPKHNQPTSTLKQQRQQLFNACQQNQPADIRQALIRWGSAFLHSPNQLSLEQIQQQLNQPEINLAISELNATLYSPTPNSAFNGQRIWQLVKQLKQPNTTTSATSLPELQIK